MGRPRGSVNKKTLKSAKEAIQAEGKETLSVIPLVVENLPWEEEKPPKVLHTIKGYVNVQANPLGGYYLGSDIHATLDRAKQIASKNTMTQIYVAFEVTK